MTHFLARLVERARGTAPRVEPIIAPRFAPAPIAEIATESEAAPPAARRETGAPAAPDRAVVRQEKVEPGRPIDQPAEKSVEVVRKTLLVPLERVVSEPPLVVKQRETEEREIPVRTNGAVPEASPTRVRAARPGSPIPATTGGRVIVAGVADPGHGGRIERLRISPNDTAAERPIVRVTIGRIEVRATSAPVAPARKAAPRSEAKLSLDAYLKARKEGAR